MSSRNEVPGSSGNVKTKLKSGRRGFINKKEGLHFTLLHRSQQDPLYHAEGGSKFILHPANDQTARAVASSDTLREQFDPAPNGSTDKKTLKIPFAKEYMADYVVRELREVNEEGLPLDGYDYTQHMSQVGGGTFMNVSGELVQSIPTALPRKNHQEDEEDDEFQEDYDEAVKIRTARLLPAEAFASRTEAPRMLEAITLDPQGMDEDMKRQLGLLEDDDENFSDGEFEEDSQGGDLDDDFVLQLVEKEKAAEEAEEDDEDDGFDFDAHVARLAAQAELDDENLITPAAAARRARQLEEDSQYDPNELDPDLAARKKRDVDEAFDLVLAQYEDGYDEEQEELEAMAEMDALAALEKLELEGEEEDDEDDMERASAHVKFARSARSVATSRMSRMSKGIGMDDQLLESALDEFLAERRVIPKKKQVPQPTAEPELPPSEENLEEGEEEEEFVRVPLKVDPSWGETYLTPKYLDYNYQMPVQRKHDVESIVSTYSTTDNLPTTLSVSSVKPSKRRSNNKRGPTATETIPEEEEVEEVAVEKQAEEAQGEDDDEKSEAESLATNATVLMRSKGETPEERKARKAAVKQQRKDRRLDKSETKKTFKEEKARVKHALTAPNAPKPGVSEFKI